MNVVLEEESEDIILAKVEGVGEGCGDMERGCEECGVGVVLGGGGGDVEF